MTKAKSARLYAQGYYGNHARQWLTVDDFLADPDRFSVKTVTIRGRYPQGPFHGPLDVSWLHPKAWVSGEMALTRYMWDQLCLLMQTERRPPEDFYVSENVDSRHCMLNAEVMRSHRGLEILYSTERATMREALASSPQHAHGLAAKILVDRFTDPRGRDAIYELIDEFDGHVVEFSVFDIPVGVLGWNTIIWEVRDY